MKFLFLVATIPLFSATVLATAAAGSRSNTAFKNFKTPARKGLCHILEVEDSFESFITVMNGRCHNLFVESLPDRLAVQGNGGVTSITVFSSEGCKENPAAVGVDTLELGGKIRVASMLFTC